MIELATIALWIALAVIVGLVALIGLADLVWRAWRLLVTPGDNGYTPPVPNPTPGKSLAGPAHTPPPLPSLENKANLKIPGQGPAHLPPGAPTRPLAWWNRPAVTITLRPPG